MFMVRWQQNSKLFKIHFKHFLICFLVSVEKQASFNAGNFAAAVLWLFCMQDQLEERLPCSPLCVTVRVIGHYFLPGKELPPPSCFLKPSGMVRGADVKNIFAFLSFSSCMDLSSRLYTLSFCLTRQQNIKTHCQASTQHCVCYLKFCSSQVFPALGVLSYRTTLIQNRGDLPLTFCLDPSSDPVLAKAVSIVPSCGLIAPGCHQILTVKTTPKEDSPKQGFSVYFRLNATKNTKVLYGLYRKTEEQSIHMFCTQLNLCICASVL